MHADGKIERLLPSADLPSEDVRSMKLGRIAGPSINARFDARTCSFLGCALQCFTVKHGQPNPLSQSLHRFELRRDHIVFTLLRRGFLLGE